MGEEVKETKFWKLESRWKNSKEHRTGGGESHYT